MQKHKACVQLKQPVSEESKKFLIYATDVVYPRGTVYQPTSCVPTYRAAYECKLKNGGNHEYNSHGVSFEIINIDISKELSELQEAICLEMLEESVSPVNNIHYPTLHVKYQTIPEPGKNRVITKGPSTVYTAVRGLQGFMMKQWANMCFSTMCDDIDARIKSIMSKEVTRPRGDDSLLVGKLTPKKLSKICSGDYEATTDFISWEVSQIIMERILTNLGIEGTHLGVLARMCFEKVIIEYPKMSKTVKAEDILQENGQLMGNPLSFAVLCVANLSTYMRAFGFTKRSELIDRNGAPIQPMLINGDDIVFTAETSFYKAWVQSAADIGLKKSLGKNYYVRDWFMINSRMYRRRDFRLVGYYNQGLVSGHKLKGDPARTLGTWANNAKICAVGLPEDIADRAIGRYIKNNKGLLKAFNTIGFSPNWFLPFKLGGLGMENRHPERELKTTASQRRVATYLYRNPLERFVFEKLNSEETPYAVTTALKKFRKVVKHFHTENVNKRFVGPLRELEDYEAVCDHRLGVALANNAYVRDPRFKTGEHPLQQEAYEGSGYSARLMVREILNKTSEKSAMKHREVVKLKVPRVRIIPDVPCPSTRKPFWCRIEVDFTDVNTVLKHRPEKNPYWQAVIDDLLSIEWADRDLNGPIDVGEEMKLSFIAGDGYFGSDRLVADCHDYDTIAATCFC
jgi:hypothetical protein